MMSLPSGYTQVEYIESGSLQYIDTGFYPNQDTRVVFKAYNKSSSSAWIYGARKTSNSGLFGAMIGNGIVYGTQSATIDMTAIGDMEIDQNKNQYRFNDVAGSLAEQTFSSDYPMYLFACNGSGEATSLRFNGRLYSCKIYDGETLARNYIPCKDSNGLVGLYDLVNGEFCTRAVGGAFISGPEIRADIDFAKLQGLSIPKGNVVKIEDAAGNVIWAVKSESSEPAVLEVAKQTLTTYAGETSYADETFILLDIYPKNASSTVNVTYGGLTKTLTFSGTNAQQVYFGTFNGVSDSVTTPASGALTIEGGCIAFGCGSYTSGVDEKGEAMKKYCSCITAVNEWGNITHIPNYAFYYCSEVCIAEIPHGVKSIGASAFEMESLKEPGEERYYAVTNMKTITLPETIESIGEKAFYTFHGVAVVSRVTFLATTPPTLGTNAFSSENLYTITVPKGCGEAYKTAEGWSTYASYITEVS